MEKEAEFPAPADPPIVDVSVTSEETTEAPQVATVVAKSTRPRLPVIFYRLMPKPRLKAVEQYIASFEYSLHPQTNFNSQKQRPLCLIMDTAKMIIASPQPIKCVEAVFVALFLTAGLPDVERYPLSFQTVLDDQVYQHIVLVVQHFGKFGAVGISRWPEFCSKDLKFHRMSSVIENYKTAYEEQHHVVEKIRVGLPVEHNTRSTNFVCWRHLELDLKELPWRDCVEAIDDFAAQRKRLWNSWIRSRGGEDPRRLYIRQTKRMHADRESSPYEAKSLNSTVQLTTEVFENSESMDLLDTKIVNCRFNIQPPSSRESARIALSLEPGEVSYFWKKAPHSVLPKEFCFDKSPVAVRLPSKHGFTKFRRSKKAFKSGGDAAIQPAKSARGAIRSLPRAALSQSQSNGAPLAVSQCIVGTKHLNATPGFDGSKACWECLRTLYRTKNEVRLLLLKDKLADLQMQGPSQMEAFRVVQDIFQQLVGIGEAITSQLDGFEGMMNALSTNFDVVVESVNNQKELQSLKQLSKQLAEESLTEDQQLMINFQNKKGVHAKSSPTVGKSRSTSPYLKKMAYDAETHVHYRIPPCNWCGHHGHRMREGQDLEIEIAQRVRESKLRISLTLPERSHGELKEQGSTEESTVRSVEEPYGKVVLWHKHQLHENQLHNNQVTELAPSKVREQIGDSNAQPVAGKKLELLPGGEDQQTTPKEKRGSKMSRKKRLVQRRLQTKLMYCWGNERIIKSNGQTPLLRNVEECKEEKESIHG